MSELTGASSLALTIDVEAQAEALVESVSVATEFLRIETQDGQIADNLEVTLELLAGCNTHATFFFLGRIAKSRPDLVRRVAEGGHEIGCHALEHRRIFGQSRESFRRDLTEAKWLLEDACGQPVIGFRAPDFSIGQKNLWAIDELRAAGFLYDSSIVPTGWHDVYGMRGTPHGLFRWPNGLVEFPLPVLRLLFGTLPIGGGGYFRVYPFWVTRVFFGRRGRSETPTTFYAHPCEIGGIAPRLPGLSWPRRFRHYSGLSKGRRRMETLLHSVRFTTMSAVLRNEGFIT